MATDTVPHFWREAKYLYRLIGSKCKKCDATSFPRRRVCRKCGSREVEECKLSETGHLLSYTVIRSAPRSFEKMTPYILGLIELDDRTRIVSQLADCSVEDVHLGMPVELTFRKTRELGKEGIVEYGFKFRPRIQS